MKARRFLPYALFVVLVCAFLWKPIFTGAALLPGDMLVQMAPWNSVAKPSSPAPQWNPLQWDAIAQYYPWRVFYARSMSGGHIPLWNPHQFCGTPFLANAQSAVLYPPNLLFLLFDPITAFTVFAALHLFLAAALTYRLLRDLGCGALGGTVSGITYAFSAFTVVWLELPTFVAVAVFLPLVLLLIHRAVELKSPFHGMLAGAAMALAVLAGHFQVAFYVGLAAILWWVWKLIGVRLAEGRLSMVSRVALPLCAFLLIAGLIASAQVLPTQELASNSHRTRAVTAEGYDWFVANGVRPYRLVTAFAPDFFGNPAYGNYYLLGRIDHTRHVGSAADYMEYGMYAGVLPLLLALLALGRVRRQRHVGFFALLALLALVTALGTPINRLFYYLIPGFSALGGPNRILILYVFSVAVLAGFGAEHFAEHAAEKTKWRGRETPVGVMATLVVFVIVGVIYSVTYALATAEGGNVAEPLRQQSAALSQHAGMTFAILLLISIGLLLARASDTVTRPMFAWMSVVLIVADLFLFGINYNPTCDRSKVYPQTKLTAELKRLTKHGERIAPINPDWSLFRTPRVILPPNAAMVYGLYDVQGYDSLFTRAYKDRSSQLQGVDSSPPENGNMVLVRQLGEGVNGLAGYAVSEGSLAGAGGSSQAPLVSVDGVGIYRLVQRYDGINQWKRSGVPGPLAIAYRTWGPDEVIRGTSPAQFEYLSANAVRVRSALRGGKSLVFLTPTCPGWMATTSVGSAPVDLGRPFLSTRISGPETAVFTFEPFSFRLGLFCALVGIALLTGAGVCRTLRDRRPKR